MTGIYDRYAPFTDVASLTEISARPLRKSVRVNTLKVSVNAFRTYAAGRGWTLTPVPWCTEGFFVERDDVLRAIGKDLWHLVGRFYVQEAASMLPVTLLDPQSGEAILDIAAAPGSKTTQIAARMGHIHSLVNGYAERERCADGVIVANDIQEKRLWTLKGAIHRLGVRNVLIVKKVGQWYGKHLTERFDRVLCDAPCTAQGIARKDPTVLQYTSEHSIAKASALQGSLLEAALHATKVGGRIVYSTCTLTPEENELVVLGLLERFAGMVEVIDPLAGELRMKNQELRRAVDASKRVQEFFIPHSKFFIPALRLWPQDFDTEGFFCAVLRKTAPTKAVERMEWKPRREEPVSRRETNVMRGFLEERYGTSFLEDDERLSALGDHLSVTTEDVIQFPLPVTDFSQGLPFGRRLRDAPVYVDHEMATLRGNAATKNVCDVPAPSLDLLLRGENCPCPESLLGHVLIRHGGLCIGRGRAKNGILKNHIPRWIVQVAT